MIIYKCFPIIIFTLFLKRSLISYQIAILVVFSKSYTNHYLLVINVIIGMSRIATHSADSSTVWNTSIGLLIIEKSPWRLGTYGLTLAAQTKRLVCCSHQSTGQRRPTQMKMRDHTQPDSVTQNNSHCSEAAHRTIYSRNTLHWICCNMHITLQTCFTVTLSGSLNI